MRPESIPFRWFLAALLAALIGLSSSLAMGVVILTAGDPCGGPLTRMTPFDTYPYDREELHYGPK